MYIPAYINIKKKKHKPITKKNQPNKTLGTVATVPVE